MKKLYKILFIISFLFLSIATYTSGASLLPDNYISLSKNEKIKVLKKVIKEIQLKIEKIILKNRSNINVKQNRGSIFKNYEKPNEFKTIYDVKNGKISLSEGYDSDKIRKIWKLFSDMALKDFIIDNNFNKYKIFENDETPVVASVFHGGSLKIKTTTTKVNGEKIVKVKKSYDSWWQLYVNYSAIDMKNDVLNNQRLVKMLIHELTHVITLNDNQGEYFVDKNDCKNTYYSNNEMCSKKDSYINKFVKEFWTKEDLLSSLKNKDSSFGKENFYKKNSDKFVTRYSSINPEEDIVESFVYFVYDEKIDNPKKIKDKKKMFFYQFPELVNKRNHIRSIIFK